MMKNVKEMQETKVMYLLTLLEKHGWIERKSVKDEEYDVK
jgi:hypothetical protein